MATDTKQQTATDTLVPTNRQVRIDDREYDIAPFKLAKTMVAFRLLTQLAEASGVGEAALAANTARDELAEAVENGQPATGFLTKLLTVLPKAFANGTPELYKLLGLIVTHASELMEWEDAEKDIDRELFAKGRKLAYSGSNDEVMELVAVGVGQIGIETIVGKFPMLLAFANRM